MLVYTPLKQHVYNIVAGNCQSWLERPQVSGCKQMYHSQAVCEKVLCYQLEVKNFFLDFSTECFGVKVESVNKAHYL